MKKNQIGFTLLECMIALTLGTATLALSTFMYTNFTNMLYRIKQHVKQQNNYFFVLHWLTREIRHAGFIGPVSLKEIKMKGQHAFLEEEIIKGWKGTQNPLISSQQLDPESDVLLVQYADSQCFPILNARKDSVFFKEFVHFNPKTVFLLSDCYHAETLQLADIHLQHCYDESATMRKLHKIVYYVGRSPRKHSNASSYALYRRDLNAPLQNPIELVDEVKRFCIHYGLFNEQNIIHYISADQVSDWRQVKSVNFVLEMAPKNFQLSRRQIFFTPQILTILTQLHKFNQECIVFLQSRVI